MKKNNIALFLLIVVIIAFFLHTQDKTNTNHERKIEDVKNELKKSNENYLDLENTLADTIKEYELLLDGSKKVSESLTEMKEKYDYLLNDFEETNLDLTRIDSRLKSYIEKLNSNEDIFIDVLSFSEENSSSYYNSKYAYSIKFPNEWLALNEPPAGDGIYLYNHNNFDIRVYGGYRVEPPNHPQNHIDENTTDGYSSAEVISDTRDIGILQLKTEKEKILLEYYLISEEKYSCFYAIFSKEYYETNKEVILEIIKTIEIKDL